MSDAWAWFSQFPPVSRTLTAAAFVSSLLFYAKLVSPYLFAWMPRLLLQSKPDLRQLLAFFTNFLITGPKVGMMMDPYWLYKWSSELELNNSRFSRREDYLWYLIFVCGTIHVFFSSRTQTSANKIRFSKFFNYFLTGGGFLLNALELAMCYTACQDARGQQHGLFFFQVPAQMMPLAMIVLTMLMTGKVEATYLQFVGLLAAHMYDFLSRIYPEFGGVSNLIPTPSWVGWIARTPPVLRRAYGTAIRGSGDASSGSGPLPDSWKTRGRGQRLGTRSSL